MVVGPGALARPARAGPGGRPRDRLSALAPGAGFATEDASARLRFKVPGGGRKTECRCRRSDEPTVGGEDPGGPSDERASACRKRPTGPVRALSAPRRDSTRTSARASGRQALRALRSATGVGASPHRGLAPRLRAGRSRSPAPRARRLSRQRDQPPPPDARQCSGTGLAQCACAVTPAAQSSPMPRRNLRLTSPSLHAASFRPLLSAREAPGGPRAARAGLRAIRVELMAIPSATEKRIRRRTHDSTMAAGRLCATPHRE